MKSLCVVFVWSLLASAVSVCAQVSPPPSLTAKPPVAVDAEKEKARAELDQKAFALLNRIGEEGALLKLPENRIFILTSTAELVWTNDEKRARRLYLNAAEAIAAALAETEAGDPETHNIFHSIVHLRMQLITKIAPQDAEFALEILRQTRKPEVQALLGADLALNRFRGDQQIVWQVKQEAQLEQQLAAQIARQNPARALEIARETLAREFSHNLFTLVQNIKTKDAETAAAFVEEIAAKLLAADLAADSQARSFAAAFLMNYAPKNQPETTAEKPLAAEKTVRDVAEKLAAAFVATMQNNQGFNHWELQNTLPIIERLLPERAAVLRRRQENFNVRHPQQAAWDKLNKLQQTGTAEQILAEADNFPPEMYSQVVQAAANKITQNGGDEARARQILNLISSKRERESMLRNFEQNRLQQSIGNNKIEDAVNIIGEIQNRHDKFNSLVNLALVLHGKKQTELAEKMLAQARLLIVEPAADEAEVRNVLQLARAFGAVAPERAFELLEPLIGQANELMQAHAALGKFHKQNGYFRDGEFVLMNFQHSNLWSFGDTQPILQLAETNFERLENFADRFERAEVRLSVKMLIAQAVLRGRAEGNQNSDFVRGKGRGVGFIIR